MPAPATETSAPQKTLSRSERMGQGSVARLLVQFSLPAIVGMMTQALYNLIDRVFIGRALGDDGIAGITVCFPFMLILIAFGMLVGFGAAAVISIRLGERHHAAAERALGNAAVMLVIASFTLTVIGQLFLDPLLRLFGASEMVLPYAHDYMQIILWATIFQLLGFGLNAAIRAEGNPPIAMITMLVGVLLNIALAPFLIFDSGWPMPIAHWLIHSLPIFYLPGCGWGMKGAALATACAQCVSATWVVWYFIGGRSLLKLRAATMRLHWPTCRKILLIGSPPCCLQLAACVLQGILNHQLKFYGGDMAIAIIGVIWAFVMMLLMPIFGLNQGAQPLIGFNYGAQKFDRVKRTLLSAIIFACTVTTGGYAIIWFFPTQIFLLFDPQNAAMATLGAHAMRVSMMMLPVVGFQIVGASYFQAVGKPKISMLLSLSRQILLLIPAVLILPAFYGLEGVWYALPTADACSSILTGACLFLELRHLQRRHREG